MEVRKGATVTHVPPPPPYSVQACRGNKLEIGFELTPPHLSRERRGMGKLQYPSRRGKAGRKSEEEINIATGSEWLLWGRRGWSEIENQPCLDPLNPKIEPSFVSIQLP